MEHAQTLTLKRVSLSWGKALMAAATATLLSLGLFASANALTVSGCEFDDTTPGIWSLEADCTTTGPINVPADTMVEGNGYTISAGYNFGSNGAGTNTVIGVIGADNVTINNLTVDGEGGAGLHGINVYESTGVVLNDVNIKNNDKSGLGINSSEVTVNNITTEGNGWHGINVDQRTSEPSSLTINGQSSHNEYLQVYVDDTTRDVTVVDTNNQYIATNPQHDGNINDANYALKEEAATTKEACKNGGWQTFQTAYKNQGDCVSAVASNGKAKGNPSPVEALVTRVRGLFN